MGMAGSPQSSVLFWYCFTSQTIPNSVMCAEMLTLGVLFQVSIKQYNFEQHSKYEVDFCVVSCVFHSPYPHHLQSEDFESASAVLYNGPLGL
ncbi:hypothetical protein TNIN_113261 [Trichonephila inaurata madagascariensis]|uniref:Uncharacterized protein n=1 Tax=Trichonephila inaurata madagascariensis TaxID=2747483 RepID=A0A8X6YFM3_9ARAC|nr:hypothetical protein TNIN_113261 [Trichonephila inaurata madagascariensis]